MGSIKTPNNPTNQGIFCGINWKKKVGIYVSSKLDVCQSASKN